MAAQTSRAVESAAMSKELYLYLTTTGHITGNPHEIEIWFVEHGGSYFIVAEKREAAHWVRNIRAESDIAFRIGEDSIRGSASFPDDPQLLEAVKAKMEAKYGWSNGLVVALAPEI